MAKHKGGRPTEYKPEFCKQIIDFMSNGKSLTAFAASIGHHRDSVYEWTKVHPEFSDALKKGRAASEAWWESIGIEGTLGQIKNFNPTAFVWMTKNMFGWKDKTETEHTLSQSLNDLILKSLEAKE